MRTLFVCSERKINDHVGEYYDDIFEVPHQPTTTDIQDYAVEVRQRIRDLWKQDVEDKDRDGDSVVVVSLDAASPYNAMLIDYQIVMGKEEGVTVELPYLDTATRTTSDVEAIELIRKLEERKGRNINGKV